MPAVPGKYKAWSLPIIITIQEPSTLTLTSLTFFLTPAKNLDTTPTVSLPKDKTTIVADDITALFSYGRTRDKKIPVTVTGGENLKKGTNTIKLSVVAKDGMYKAWGPQNVEVTIREDNAEILILKSLKICTSYAKDLDNPSVQVEDNVTTIKQENVTAKFDYATQHDVEIPVDVEHGEDIEGGENRITLKVKESAGIYLAWEKEVIVTKMGIEQDLTLSSLSVHKVSCKNVPADPVCEVPLDKTSVTPADVLAQFNYGDKLNKALEVEVLNGATLNPGENVINLRVPAKQYRYKEWTGSVKVIRKKTEAKLTLKELFIHGEEVKSHKVSFAHKYKTIEADDVKATFEIEKDPIVTQVIPVEVRGCPHELEVDKPTKITLHVPASKDEYEAKDIEVEVTRKALPEKEPSIISAFKFNGTPHEVSQITANTVLTSGTLKPVVTLETGRMFEKIKSDEFGVAEYANNDKTVATLTLKEDLKKSEERRVTIKVTTKIPNAEQEDLEKILTFKIKLAQGQLAITKIEIEGKNITEQNKTIKVNKLKAHVFAYIANNNATGLTATLNDGSGASYQGDNSQKIFFSFKDVAFTEQEKTFTVTVKSFNAQDATFTFQAKYEKENADKVVITEVKVNDKPITENASFEVSKPNGTEVKVYLQKEYENMEVTIAGVKATQPFAPGNKTIFSSVINNLENNVAKEIKIVAKAKDKADAEFKFTLTFKRPAGAKLISFVEAQGNESANWQKMMPSSTNPNAFGPVEVIGDLLEKLRVTIEDLNGKDVANLKIEVTGKGEKQEATFTQDGANYVATITYQDGPVLSVSGTPFTLKLLEKQNQEFKEIETYTVTIKAGQSSWGG